MHIPAAFLASRTGVAPDPGTGGRRGGGSMLFIHIDPTGVNPDGKVADLTLTYRVPGSADVKIADHHAAATRTIRTRRPTMPYLSQPEMAPRFAMYNMFLGFRTAVQNPNYNCARSRCARCRPSATAWNTTHENADIAADLTLVDRVPREPRDVRRVDRHHAGRDDVRDLRRRLRRRRLWRRLGLGQR